MFFKGKKIKETVKKKLEKIELDLRFAEDCDLESTRDKLIAQREILIELLNDIERL
jgi:hypothetical protein